MFKAFIERLFSGGIPWDGSDRRLGIRAKCTFDLEVAGEGFSFMGASQNVGPRGIRVKIRGPWNARQMRKGQEVRVKYLTPLFDAELDTVKAKIEWAKKEGNDMFSLALTFVDNVETLRRSWVKPILVKALKSRAAQKRKLLRVTANMPAGLLVDGKGYDGKIRDLSVGGAKLECFTGFREGTYIALTVIPLKPAPPMPLKALVRRCTLVLGTYEMGLAFLLDERDKKTLFRQVKELIDVQNRDAL